MTARRSAAAHRIYLDACCLNRPFDDLTQPRIRLESDAVILIIERVAAGAWLLLGSDVLRADCACAPVGPGDRASARSPAPAALHPILQKLDITAAFVRLQL